MNEWIVAGLAVAGGIVAGALADAVARRVIRRRSETELAGAAKPTGRFLFWFFVFLGVVAGVALLTPTTLETLPRDILEFLPRVLVAGLVVIGAWFAAGGVSRMVRRMLASAPVPTRRAADTLVRGVVLVTGLVFAVAQLGIDTTILTILVAVGAGAVGAAFVLLVGLGGRRIAAEVAAGRYLARHLDEGMEIVLDGTDCIVVSLHPATLVLQLPDGSQSIVTYERLLDADLRMAAS